MTYTRFHQLAGWLFIASFLMLSAQAQAQAQAQPKPANRTLQIRAAPSENNRIALIIGNSKYLHAPLGNPANDAADVAAALTQQGFEVVTVLDADKQKMRDAINRFGDLLGPQSVAVVFYAGHGLQVNGRNYLVPTDAVIRSAEEVEGQSIALDWVMQRIETRKPRFNIVILDACRNNPFSERHGAGLAAVDAPAGSLIAFSTSPSKVASDGAGRNGLYTHHLLQHLGTPQLKIEDLFKRVRIGVMEQSAGAQVPWENTSLTADLVLSDKSSPASAPAPGTTPAVNLAWLAGADIGRLKSHLMAHPVDAGRDAVTLAFAKANAERPLRKEALKLADKDCDQCPRLTSVPATQDGPGFHIAIDLVTVEEYQHCVKAGVCRKTPSPALERALAAYMPVTHISLEDANRYVDWLNQQSAAKRYSIPTQGQWMKVFRSGYFLDNGRALAASKGLCEIGNFYDISGAVVSPFPWAPNTCNDAFPSTAPVGAFLPSLDGLFDLVGNLWQLTRSCAEGGEISSQRQCKKVRLVGGSWATAPRWNWQTPPEITAEPDLVTDIFGLRVVATDRR